MPCIQYVFLDKARIPSIAELQGAVDAFGFKLVFDTKSPLDRVKGRFACRLNDVDSGFELENYTAKDLLHEDPGFRKFAGTHDWCFAIRFEIDPGERLCTQMFCAALIKLSDAVSIFEDSDAPDTVDELVTAAKAGFEEFQSMPNPKPKSKPTQRAVPDSHPLAERDLEKPWWKFW